VYTVVFDARNAGVPGWEGIPIALLFLALTYLKRQVPASKPRARALAWFLRNALFIFACTVAIVTTLGTVGSTWRVRYRLNHGDYNHGDYTLVEGVVSDFVPGDWIGHRHELWRVRSGDKDYWYTYSRAIITSGTRQTQEEGGPIRNGVRVRIADMDGLIARLEVATADLEGTR
jgi:hypothetical protein